MNANSLSGVRQLLLEDGLVPDLSGVGPLVFFVRVPSWLGKHGRHPENCEAPLDLGYCAALALRSGCRPVIIDLESGAYSLEKVEDCLDADKPQVVFLSAISPAAGNVLRLARAAKKANPSCTIVACGHHADASPRTFLFSGSPVDLCIRGELEETSSEILKALSTGENPCVLGTAYWKNGSLVDQGPRPLIQDLDRLPFPSHDFFQTFRYRHLHPMQAIGPYRWGFVQASRGCPFPCIYCSKSLRTSFGDRYRLRSPQSVVEEMRYLEDKGVNTLVFTDDVFNSSRERVMALCDAISSSGLKISWKAQGRAHPVDLDMFRAMRKAGCSTFSIGVESGSPRILKELKKQVSVEEIENAFRLAREAGLLRVGFFMVGCPTETDIDFELTRSLLCRLDPDMIQVAYFTCYPGSEAYNRYIEDKDDQDFSQFQHYESFRNLSSVPDHLLRRWQKTLYKQFMLRPSFLLRYARMKNINLLLNYQSEFFLVIQAIRSVFLGGKE